ncbi:MAG: NAD-dependent DNA ligase LigA, partial [Phycisphaerae bacterium]|nr:NAD-dependent DNA ligase LigA [Phycisphaerae bacterium]
MSRDQDLSRIDELRLLLVQANTAYYEGDAPVMSDRDFDARLYELHQLELAYPEAWSADSPTRVVGRGEIDAFQTLEHVVPMQSIDNTYTIEEVRSWYERVSVDEQSPLCTCDPKIDGVAVSLRYEAGRLVRALTRGDGMRGDDITAQVKRIQDVPVLLASSPPAILEVRGELFMPNSIFEQVNAEREASGEPLYANSRNLTAGTLKSLKTGV